MINLGIDKLLKKIVKRFLNYREICGRRPNCIQKMITKATERRLNKILILSRNRPKRSPSFFLYSLRWKQTATRWNYFSRPHHFL